MIEILFGELRLQIFFTSNAFRNKDLVANFSSEEFCNAQKCWKIQNILFKEDNTPLTKTEVRKVFEGLLEYDYKEHSIAKIYSLLSDYLLQEFF